MLQVGALLALLFAIVIAVFAVQNTAPVQVSFLWLLVDRVAVSVLVLVSAALGAAVMLLLGLAREVRLQLSFRTLSQQLRNSEARIKELEQTHTAVSLATPGETAGPGLGAPPTPPAPLPLADR